MGLTGSIISIGADMGGTNASNATMPHIFELRKLLQVELKPPYSPDVDEFAMAARVDGDVHCFESEGVERVRRNRKGRYIGVDICIPIARWQVPPEVFRRYLAEQVRLALEACIDRLRQQKVPVEAERLLNDYDAVARRFLEGSASR